MGKFEPGHKKLGGRAKGVENKEKKELREFILDFLNDNKH